MCERQCVCLQCCVLTVEMCSVCVCLCLGAVGGCNTTDAAGGAAARPCAAPQVVHV